MPARRINRRPFENNSRRRWMVQRMAVATVGSRFPQKFSSDFATSVNDAQNHNSVTGFHLFVNNDVRRNDTNAHARPKDGRHAPLWGNSANRSLTLAKNAA